MELKISLVKINKKKWIHDSPGRKENTSTQDSAAVATLHSTVAITEEENQIVSTKITGNKERSQHRKVSSQSEEVPYFIG